LLERPTIEAIADELLAAARSRKPVPRLTVRHPDMTVEDSYAVQRIWRERKEAAGRRLVGRKIGLTSKAMQDATGITEPDYGAIFDDMVLDTGCSVEWEQYSHPRVEVELAFVLKKDLTGPGCGLVDVLNATDFVVPALEILDSRIEMEGRTIVDTTAAGRPGSALGFGDPLPQPGRRGNRRRCRRSGPPGQRGSLAGQQDCTARGRPEGRGHHSGRFLHPPPLDIPGGQRTRRLWTPGSRDLSIRLGQDPRAGVPSRIASLHVMLLRTQMLPSAG
jgi:hypothetical protein